jgi:hypothetical protein
VEVPGKEINEINNLPVIRIISEEDEMFTKLNLEMEDDTHAMLVKWGKEVATDEDYISIAIREGIMEAIENGDRDR